MIAAHAPAAQPTARVASELVLADLLHDFAELERLLAGELEHGHRLDAFLLAAGMNQVVEDHLHDDLASLAKVAATLRGPAGSAMGRVRRALIDVRTQMPGKKAVIEWQADFAELVLELACQVAGRPGREPDWQGLLGRSARLPSRLRAGILRLPTCFRSLDLMPEDMEQLATAFTTRQPDRGTPLIVVGIRTSGSYLAPLQAAYLRRQGFESVGAMTLRPGLAPLAHERAELRRAAEGGAVAIVVDDPPSSGGAVAKTAALLEASGFSKSRIVLCLPVVRAPLPETLRGFHSVVLERSAWAIEARLRPAAVRSALSEMRGIADVEWVTRLPMPEIDDPWEEALDRRHVRALYEVDVLLPGGTRDKRHVYAKGVGLGYFGRHSLAVAESLSEYVPELLAAQDGLLFRSWQPEARRLGKDRHPEHVPERIAGYVHARSQSLRSERDLSVRMVGRQAVWQRTADMLMEPFGRLRLPLRPFVHRLARRLLQAEAPSVVDGSMGLHHWFATAGPDAFEVKVDNDERAYSNEDIYSYDAIYDLGAAASSLRAQVGSEPARLMRSAYERIADVRVDEVRWFLYQLLSARLNRQSLRVHAGGARAGALSELIGLLDGAEDALETAQRDFMCACFLGGVEVGHDGPICVIDIDGTLETAPLGFTTIGPLGALALRALANHGYRAVLASGRSLDEVRVRCDSYALAAGVAEYGSVVYNAVTRQCVELLTDADLANLDRVRAAAGRIDAVNVDERYARSVRMFTVDRRGRRRGLSAQDTSAILAAAGVGHEVVAVPGWSQTDFVSTRVDKAAGLRIAAGLIGPNPGAASLELAVGDAMTDLPMLQIARRACVPANGDPRLRAHGVKFMHGSGQAGLAEAVAELIGHSPGGCSVCQAPERSHEARLLLDLIAGYDRSGWGRVRTALSLAWAVQRGR